MLYGDIGITLNLAEAQYCDNWCRLFSTLAEQT